MPYKVEITQTEANKSFLENLPKSILPDLKKHLEHLGNNPNLGRSVNAPIPAYIYSFEIKHEDQNNTFVVSYKMDENSNIIYITNFGRQIIKRM